MNQLMIKLFIHYRYYSRQSDYFRQLPVFQLLAIAYQGDCFGLGSCKFFQSFKKTYFPCVHFWFQS